MPTIEEQLSNPLAELEDDALIRELRSRHEACLVAVLDHYHSVDNPGGQESINVAFWGGKYVCVGLAQQFIHDVMTGNVGETPINYDNDGDDVRESDR